MNIKDLEEFEKKFITRTAFGVSIGAIDNLNESAENQVKSFIIQDRINTIKQVLEMLLPIREYSRNISEEEAAYVDGWNCYRNKLESKLNKLIS